MISLNDVYSAEEATDATRRLEAERRGVLARIRDWESAADRLALEAWSGNDNARLRYAQGERADWQCVEELKMIDRALRGVARKAARDTPQHGVLRQLIAIQAACVVAVSDAVHAVLHAGVPHQQLAQERIDRLVVVDELRTLNCALNRLTRDTKYTDNGPTAAELLRPYPLLFERLRPAPPVRYDWQDLVDVVQGRSMLSIEEASV